MLTNVILCSLLEKHLWVNITAEKNEPIIIEFINDEVMSEIIERFEWVGQQKSSKRKHGKPKSFPYLHSFSISQSKTLGNIMQ